MMDDMVPVAALKRMSQHTRSLAAIHDILTQQIKDDAHTDTISAKAILDKLVPLLQNTAGERRFDYEADDFTLPVREGASFTLLVSEIVGNALKHGAGDITVRFASGGRKRALNRDGSRQRFSTRFNPDESGEHGTKPD